MTTAPSQQSNDTIHGWVLEDGGRGTFNILTSCIFTIFLCCWTSVCVNVPAVTETKWQQFLDKAKLAFLGIMGPDYLLMLAIGQYDSAKSNTTVSMIAKEVLKE